jgi:SAM-dependent methyltransferase
VKASEFDKFADEYLAAHTENLAITGEDPEYFARYKIEEISRLYRSKRLPNPRRILDFGCGIGNSVVHLKAAFPQAQVVGLDVSARSLDIARGRFPNAATYEIYDGAEIKLPQQSYDLIFSSCVFHHIDAAEHLSIFRQLRRLLAANGAMIIFEHNPLNPVSRYIVATCPFDENAVLIPGRDFARTQRKAGFGSVEVAYTGFFPGGLRGLRPLEPFLRGVPLGAQYYTFARA